MPRISICLATLFATALPAHATPEEDASDLMYVHAQALATLRTDLVANTRRTAESCNRVLDDARAGNVPASFELTGDVYDKLPKSYRDSRGVHLKLGDAKVICDGLAAGAGLAQARVAVEAAQHSLAWLTMIDKATNHEDNGPKLQAGAAACRQAIATLTTAKIASIKVTKEGRTDHAVVAVADIEGMFCAPLAKAAATFSAEVKAARRAAWEKAAAPYKRAGLTGKKLDVVVALDGRAIYAVGGRELTTPKQKKAAAVLFEVLVDNNGMFTVRRYQFKGNKLVRTTSAEYRRRPGAAAFR